MLFIHKYSTISNGDSFHSGVLDVCSSKMLPSEIIHPNYREIISGVNLRRMSGIVKMGLANTKICLEDKQVEAIIIGTGLGSVHNTELFLSSTIDPAQTILSPTPFINSVHNTISGEIALILKNKEYNTTYSQGGLSFEGALLDSIMMSNEKRYILVGGVDESAPILDDILTKMNTKHLFSSGSSFFFCSNIQEDSDVAVTKCMMSKRGDLENIFAENQFNKETDFVISGASYCNCEDKFRTFDYSKYSGVYMTNSSFGLQLSVELLSKEGVRSLGDFKVPNRLERVFIINYASPHDIGVVIVQLV